MNDTTQLRVGVSQELKRRLKVLAHKQRRTLSSTVRILLEEAIEFEDSLGPSDLQRFEYEINLTAKQATQLRRRGHELRVWEPQFTQLALL